jgi:hypothetical protein
LIVFVVAACAVFAVLSLDVVRLGPATVALSPDALSMQVTWYRIRDGDPEHDYYGVVVDLSSLEADPAVQPYAVTLNLTFPGADWGGPMWPSSGDHIQQMRMTYDDNVGMGPIPLDLPQGAVQLDLLLEHDIVWVVQGERLLRSQPIFVGHANFLMDSIRYPENATMDITVQANLDWFYVNAVQAYPVASSAATARCFHAPAASEEHNVTVGTCT